MVEFKLTHAQARLLETILFDSITDWAQSEINKKDLPMSFDTVFRPRQRLFTIVRNQRLKAEMEKE